MPPALRIGSSVFGSAALALLAVTIGGRVLFDGPLEWEEGALLHHALRLVQGAPLYTSPTAEFVPFIYPPLGVAAMAVPVALWTPGVEAARIASVFALVLTLFWLARSAARLAGAGDAGWLAAGFYALGFAYCGAWYDIARVDSVFLACLALGLERFTAERPRAGLAALCAAFFAKQPGAIFLAAASLWWLWRDPRRALAPVLASWAVLALALGLAHALTDGWFSVYVFELPRAHPTDWTLALRTLGVDLPLHLPLLMVAAGAGLWRRRREPAVVDALLLASLVTTAMGFAHQGGYDNVRMPALALLAVAAAPEIRRWLATAEGSVAMRAGVAGAVVVQALWLAWWPPRYWPAPEAADRIAALERALEDCRGSGTAVALDHTLLTGTPFFHLMGLNDLIFAEGSPLAGVAARDLEATLRGPSAPGAIAVSRSFWEIDAALAGRYRPCRRVDAPLMTTGFQPPRTVVWTRIHGSDTPAGR